MIALPIVALLAGAAGLGVYLWLLQRRKIRRPVLIGVHLVLGAISLEQIAVLLHGTPSGQEMAAGQFGVAALVVIAGAMFIGLLTPIVAKSMPGSATPALWAHMGAGAAGLALVVAWAVHN